MTATMNETLVKVTPMGALQENPEFALVCEQYNAGQLTRSKFAAHVAAKTGFCRTTVERIVFGLCPSDVEKNRRVLVETARAFAGQVGVTYERIEFLDRLSNSETGGIPLISQSRKPRKPVNEEMCESCWLIDTVGSVHDCG